MEITTIMLILVIVNVLLLILAIYSLISIHIFKAKNIEFMRKLGNGTNIEELIRKYIMTTEYVNQENAILNSDIKKVEKNMNKCIQRIGVVRYNAFEDVGSNLSFAVAILDNNNDGVVLNGIYGIETSSIYAKPVTAGTSEYVLSIEEKEAIKKAIEK